MVLSMIETSQTFQPMADLASGSTNAPSASGTKVCVHRGTRMASAWPVVTRVVYQQGVVVGCSSMAAKSWGRRPYSALSFTSNSRAILASAPLQRGRAEQPIRASEWDSKQRVAVSARQRERERERERESERERERRRSGERASKQAREERRQEGRLGTSHPREREIMTRSVGTLSPSSSTVEPAQTQVTCSAVEE